MEQAAVTSADVDQGRRGLHEGQLPVPDQTCGFWGQVHRQHHKIRLFQQLAQALAVSGCYRLLLFKTPERGKGKFRQKAKTARVGGP